MEVAKMSEHASRPLFYPLRTSGMWINLAIIAFGLFFAAKRFIFGIGSVTNLNDQYPWGLWIGFDVATGVALAAGGFTSAALVEIFGQKRFHHLLRPALLTAALGYTFVALGLLADLGRYWAIWHPMMPSMWQGNSVLFEVGICVMCYLTVLYVEFAPIVFERLKEKGIGGTFLKWIDSVLAKFLFLFIIAGVVLSCLHQSSLGNLMVIAPSKMHPLWYTRLMPMLFLMSAIAVGFPMIIFESIIVSRGFKRPFEMHLLGPLSKIAAGFIALYAVFKIGDLTLRDAWPYAFEPTYQAAFFWVEMLPCLILPAFLMGMRRVRQSPRWLFIAAALYVFGVMLNRINVFVIAYRPPYADKAYVPALGEFAITAALIAGLVLCYRLIVTYLPVMPVLEEENR